MTTCTTIAGVFHSREAAERAVAELRAAGYEEDQVGLVGRDNRAGKLDVEENVAEGAASGAAIGAMAGAGTLALGSLAVSFGVIPVVGPILAVGPLAAALHQCDRRGAGRRGHWRAGGRARRLGCV